MIDRQPDIQNYLPYRFRHPSGNTFNLGDAYHYSLSYPQTHSLEDYTIVFVMDRLHANIRDLLEAYSDRNGPVKPMTPMHARVLRSFFGPIGKEMTSKEVAMAILTTRQVEVCESMGAKLPKARGPATEAKPAEEAKPARRKTLAERRADRLAELANEVQPTTPVPPPAQNPFVTPAQNAAANTATADATGAAPAPAFPIITTDETPRG